MSRFVGAALVLFIGTVVLAGEFAGTIVKTGKDSITVKARAKKGADPVEKTFKVGKDTKITKADGDSITFKELAELVEKATGDDAPKKGPKGVPAKVTTDKDDDTATKIELTKRKGKATKKDTN